MSFRDAVRFLVTLACHPPSLKGGIGELEVNIMAWFSLDKEKYHRFGDVALQLPDRTVQIDHIIVSPFGVFVIETKHKKGWIFGREKDSQWTQSIFGRKYRFDNPLRQNYAHTKALSELLGISEQHLKSVVVFMGEGEFKTEMPPNVTRNRGFLHYIKQFKEEIVPPEEVERIRSEIASRRLKPGLVTHVMHVQNLQERHGSGRKK